MTELTRLSGSLLRLVVAGALALGLVLAGTPATAATRVDQDYRSFFAGSGLEGTGWTSCPAPVTFSIDAAALRSTQRKAEIDRVRRSMRQWAQAAGVSVRFVGRQQLTLDPVSHTLRPSDGSALRDRHVYISFIREGADPLMVDPVAGLAMPARVRVAEREVVGGVALFRARHVRSLSGADNQALKGLYLHELGHVFGLGHAERAENVMHPIVVRRTELGDGDRAGVQRLIKPCPVLQ